MRLLTSFLLIGFIACAAAPVKSTPSSKAMDSVVRIHIVGHSIGTAFGVGPRLLLSAAHVCDSAAVPNKFGDYPPIRLHKLIGDGTRALIKTSVRVKAISLLHDLCLLETSDDVVAPLRFAKREPRYGDRVSIMGAPIGLLGIITKGWVARPRVVIGEATFLMLSCPVYSGNSGGPVLNKHGRVVGVLVAGYRAYHQISLAVPLDYLKDFLKTAGE